MQIDTLVVDIDGTLCELLPSGGNYSEAKPKADVINRVNDLHSAGVKIYLFTARGMKTFNGDVKSIESFHRPILEVWLNKHGVKHDKLIFGKPWGGKTYYLDDHALTIDEFLTNENFNYSSCRPSD